ncbi:MAG: hypothetical protein KKG09_02245 [Verrucomicrobia bacterium]|nr:hypothetical protein [Verrucomicrobiota bacterium]MCG2681733.1 hypothetical protein [Kiritimatiellia bacterium]MBU4247659.1 hypothetical protein [Verrucomicrobiota bacterium]MBU4290480.1 hypothetical protein [Verrucomicrobiota bacterium]MBU4428200.1 hypothetical protein [Verrucomicrobiota bacterium]
MYPLTPLKIYALDSVLNDPLCTVRMERILRAIGRTRDKVVRVDEANVPEVAAKIAGLWPPKKVPSGMTRSYMRPLVFTRIRVDEPLKPDIGPILKRCSPETSEHLVRTILGHIDASRPFHQYEDDWQKNMVCWPTLMLGTMTGCPHGCQYCGDGRSGKMIAVGLNIEETVERLIVPIAEKNPQQRCFLLIGWGSDEITFEPEHGAFDVFTTALDRLDRYVYFHTGGDNVDWIADLKHKDRLIGVWSVTCATAARIIEPGAGSAINRIEAARKCREMGVPVRIKFKPIIPVRDWRREYAEIIEQTVKRAQPESIGFCLYIWNTYKSMMNSLNPDLLDPECLDAARRAQKEIKGVTTGPFPHKVRREIYRTLIREVRKWNKDVPVYISTESREMWDDLKDELGQDPMAYICGCSPVAVPGRKLALSTGLSHSTYLPKELASKSE